MSKAEMEEIFTRFLGVKKTVWLPGDPDLSREEIESVLRAQLAVDKIIWLPDGLYNDETDGHVDNFCCYELQGLVLIHDPACQLLPGLDAFDYDDAYRVVGVVDDKINAHCCSPH